MGILQWDRIRTNNAIKQLNSEIMRKIRDDGTFSDGNPR